MTAKANKKALFSYNNLAQEKNNRAKHNEIQKASIC